MIRTILKAIIHALFKPVDFFNELSKECSFRESFIFYCVLFIILPLFTISITTLAVTFIFKIKVTLLSAAIFMAAFLAYAAIAIFLTLLTSAIMHIFVLIFRGRGGFRGTFSVIVYSNAACTLGGLILALIMLAVIASRSIGAFITIPVTMAAGIIWFITIPIIGYRIIHKMGVVRAICAFISPIIIFILANSALGMIGIGANRVTENLISAGFKKFGLQEKMPKNFAVPAQLKIPLPGKMTAGPIKWQNDLNAAFAAARNAKKPVMLDFYADWCTWCKKLDNDTYSDQNIQQLSRQFVCVKINGDLDKRSVNNFNIRGYPTIVFISPKGETIQTMPGYVDPGTLSAVMKDILTKYALPAQDSAVMLQAGRTDYRLTAIGSSKGRYNAIINDTIVYVGDTIAGAKVVDIKKDTVTLMQGDKKIVLNLT